MRFIKKLLKLEETSRDNKNKKEEIYQKKKKICDYHLNV